jgi:hypothetical protein
MISARTIPALAGPRTPARSAIAITITRRDRSTSRIAARRVVGITHRSAPTLLATCSAPAPAAAPASSSPPPPAALLSWPLLRTVAAAALCAALLTVMPQAALAKGKAVAAAAAPEVSSGVLGLAASALDFVLHLPVHLGHLVAQYGPATYAILFAIVFAETGLVIAPFLPGDSLLFATGALAAM